MPRGSVNRLLIDGEKMWLGRHTGRLCKPVVTSNYNLLIYQSLRTTALLNPWKTIDFCVASVAKSDFFLLFPVNFFH